jgi:hypothetical protein
LGQLRIGAKSCAKVACSAAVREMAAMCGFAQASLVLLT